MKKKIKKHINNSWKGFAYDFADVACYIDDNMHYESGNKIGKKQELRWSTLEMHEAHIIV